MGSFVGSKLHNSPQSSAMSTHLFCHLDYSLHLACALTIFPGRLSFVTGASLHCRFDVFDFVLFSLDGTSLVRNRIIPSAITLVACSLHFITLSSLSVARFNCRSDPAPSSSSSSSCDSINLLPAFGALFRAFSSATRSVLTLVLAHSSTHCPPLGARAALFVLFVVFHVSQGWPCAPFRDHLESSFSHFFHLRSAYLPVFVISALVRLAVSQLFATSFFSSSFRVFPFRFHSLVLFTFLRLLFLGSSSALFSSEISLSTIHLQRKALILWKRPRASNYIVNRLLLFLFRLPLVQLHYRICSPPDSSTSLSFSYLSVSTSSSPARTFEAHFLFFEFD